MPHNENQKQIKKNNLGVNKSNSIDTNSIFTLFSKETHQVNWYVHRDTSVRRSLKELWNKRVDGKDDLSTMTNGQLAATKANVLFHLLEKHGPHLQSSEFKIKLDTKHGARTAGKENCPSKGYYHTHVLDRTPTYVVIWECFEKQKVINILAIANHENFDYTQKGHIPLNGMKEAVEASKIANFNPEEPFDPRTYNNKIYPK